MNLNNFSYICKENYEKYCFRKKFFSCNKNCKIRKGIKRKEGICELRNQLVKSGTSVGALVTEAQNAETKRDFIHKMAIAQKEAIETIYWLKLISAAAIDKEENIDTMLLEAKEIHIIITSIIRTTKERYLNSKK